MGYLMIRIDYCSYGNGIVALSTCPLVHSTGAPLAIFCQHTLCFLTVSQKTNTVHNFLDHTGVAMCVGRKNQTTMGKTCV
jgi:hypothetical protein